MHFAIYIGLPVDIPMIFFSTSYKKPMKSTANMVK